MGAFGLKTAGVGNSEWTLYSSCWELDRDFHDRPTKDDPIQSYERRKGEEEAFCRQEEPTLWTSNSVRFLSES